MEPQDSVKILFKPAQAGASSFPINFIPDSGASVTVIEEANAKGLELTPTLVKLRGANGELLHTIGTFRALLSKDHNMAEEDVYVVKGLARPLLGKGMLKEMGAVHPKFPHHVWHNATNPRDREGPSNLQAKVQPELKSSKKKAAKDSSVQEDDETDGFKMPTKRQVDNSVPDEEVPDPFQMWTERRTITKSPVQNN